MKKFTDFIKKHAIVLGIGLVVLGVLIALIVFGVNQSGTNDELRTADTLLSEKIEKVDQNSIARDDTLNQAIRGLIVYIDGKVKDVADGAKSYADSLFFGINDDLNTRDGALNGRIDSLKRAIDELNKKKSSSGGGSGYSGGGGSGKVGKHNHPELADTNFVNSKLKTTPVTGGTTAAKNCNCKKKKKRRSSSNYSSFSSAYGGGGY